MGAVCNVCSRHCSIEEGGTGSCRARTCRDGEIVPLGYGRLTSMALDPVEKKPLQRFCPGSMILSVGSFGCNLCCPFCQNYEISAADAKSAETRYVSPEELAETAEGLEGRGNIGVAYTYNEPLVGWEYVRDTAVLVHEKGMKNVLVSNGSAGIETAAEIVPLMDAMNIDLKVFSEEGYKKLGGDLAQTEGFIKYAAGKTHIELTTLIVPGLNDDAGMMEREAAWIAGIDPEITLHVTRYFPGWKMKEPATPAETVYGLADTAHRYLRYVYTGNC
jgi:pyruvate formate lyase activating enzyme